MTTNTTAFANKVPFCPLIKYMEVVSESVAGIQLAM